MGCSDLTDRLSQSTIVRPSFKCSLGLGRTISTTFPTPAGKASPTFHPHLHYHSAPVSLPDGDSICHSAIHNEGALPHLRDVRQVISTLLASNHAPFDHFDDNTLWRCDHASREA